MKRYLMLLATASIPAMLSTFSLGCITQNTPPDGAGGEAHVLTGVGGAGGWTPGSDCSPGQVRACWCDLGYESVQVCSANGEAFGACDCAAECAVDADCNGTLCAPATCVDGSCARTILPEGTFITQEPLGDCAKKICLPPVPGATEMYALPTLDTTDAFDDNNDCTENLCVDGWPVNPPLAKGEACDGGICDGSGTCVPSQTPP